MALRDEDREAELRIAVEEGFIPPEGVEALREESRLRGVGPLELLKERGVISAETLVAKRNVLSGSTPTGSGKPGQAEPVFPVPGWDRYESVRFLGQGGMGLVFLAYDVRLRRNVALKFVKGDDADLIQRLLSEARAQARVEHERVCRVYDANAVEGRPYIAMQFIDGQPLGQIAETLTVEQKVLVLREAAEGVHAAHRAGLIHRDLKPSNILVERTDDGRLKPYVMDFGLAREWSERGLTATGSVLGTPHYMSPEQARGEVAQLDRRTDVYSLGATLYALLTREPPISGSNGLEVISKLLTEEPRPPRAIDPNIPRDLETIVLTCLEKDRSARYDSVRALIEDLDRFLAGEPVRPSSMGFWPRLIRKARKHRVVVSVAGVALLAVSLALGWAAYTGSQSSRLAQLASSFTQKVERIEALARYSGLSDLHDTRADRKAIREHMDELEREIRGEGALAVGPGNYALGRGYLALGEEHKAREHLEAAWKSGYQEARVAWALALVLGRLYQKQLLEADNLPPEQREARRQDIQRQYRAPALEYLRLSQGSDDVPSAEYVSALIAFYEDRFEEALSQVDAIGQRLPWFYEAPLLRGDILRTRAARRWNQGDREGARVDFEAGRSAYGEAASIGESVPEVYQALAELEYTALVMELYGRGDVRAPFEGGVKAVALALKASPESFEARLLEARLHRRLAEARIRSGAEVEEPLQKAIEAARTAQSLVPLDPISSLELGRCFQLWGLSRLVRGQEAGEQARLAVESLERIPPEHRNADFLVVLGLVLELRGSSHLGKTGGDPWPDWEQAIEAYLKAVRLDKRQLAAWSNLCRLYLARARKVPVQNPESDLTQAREASAEAAALNPQHIASYHCAGDVEVEMAQWHRALGRDTRSTLAQALALYQKGLDINRKVPQFHNGVGTVHLEQAREAWTRGEQPFQLIEQALAAFNEAIALAPGQGDGHHNVSEALLQRAVYQRALGQSPVSSLQEAMKEAREVIARNLLAAGKCNLGRAWLLLAASELDQGRDPDQNLNQAAAELRMALEHGPSLANAWQYQGETQALQARRRPDPDAAFAEAEQSFQKAIEQAAVQHYYKLAYGRFCQEWASWRAEHGKDPALQLQQGLKQADDVLRTRPHWPDALVLRAHLRVVQAEAFPAAAGRQQWLSQALKDLEQALGANPLLKREWESLYKKVRQAVPSAR